LVKIVGNPPPIRAKVVEQSNDFKVEIDLEDDEEADLQKLIDELP
jgi:hypothetical protein